MQPELNLSAAAPRVRTLTMDGFNLRSYKSSPLTTDKRYRCQHEKARCLRRFDVCRSIQMGILLIIKSTDRMKECVCVFVCSVKWSAQEEKTAGNPSISIVLNMWTTSVFVKKIYDNSHQHTWTTKDTDPFIPKCGGLVQMHRVSFTSSGRH